MFKEAVIEVGVEVLSCHQSRPQPVVVQLVGYPASNRQHRAMVPIRRTSLLRDCHDGMGRRAPHLLRALKLIPFRELALRRVQKLPRRLYVFLGQQCNRPFPIVQVDCTNSPVVPGTGFLLSQE